MVQLVSEDLQKSASNIEDLKIYNRSAGTFPEYREYHRIMESLFTRIEGRLDSKFLAVKFLPVPNWREPNSYFLEDDFYAEIGRLLRVNLEISVLATKLPTEFLDLQNYLETRLYSSSYELAGKKLNLFTASFQLESKSDDIGEALRVLSQEGYSYFTTRFDNKLRNALLHETYLIEDESVADAKYAVYGRHRNRLALRSSESISTSRIHEKAVGILLFLISTLHINRMKYAEAGNKALRKAGF